jgi:hypothetical protein
MAPRPLYRYVTVVGINSTISMPVPSQIEMSEIFAFVAPQKQNELRHHTVYSYIRWLQSVSTRTVSKIELVQLMDGIISACPEAAGLRVLMCRRTPPAAAAAVDTLFCLHVAPAPPRPYARTHARTDHQTQKNKHAGRVRWTSSYWLFWFARPSVMRRIRH